MRTFRTRQIGRLSCFAGELHDFDVGAAASLAPIGYMPATLFASPGTVVRAAMVWATAAQVTQLTWSEIPYRFGRLDDAHFAMDEADVAVEEIFAYVHRLGSAGTTAKASETIWPSSLQLQANWTPFPASGTSG